MNNDPFETDKEGEFCRPFVASFLSELDSRTDEAEWATQNQLAHTADERERARLEERLKVLQLDRQRHRL